MLFVCALVLVAQQGAPPGDPPPAPLEPEDSAAQLPPEAPPPITPRDDAPADHEPDDGEAEDLEDGGIAPDARTDDSGAPLGAPPRPVNPVLSALVGAVGGGAGAILGAVPIAMVALRPPSTEDQAFFAIAALSVLPSGAALVAGLLAVFVVMDKPGIEDLAGVAICTGLACMGAAIGALLVGLGAGGGCSGGVGSCGSCGSGNCADPTSGGDPLDSPAVAHAGGAALGAIVGICVGVVVIAVEVDSTPRVRQEAVVLGSIVGAGSGLLGAVVGGTIGGFIGADAEEGRRLSRPPPPPPP